MANDDLIAYCGLYCGDCYSYQGKIADLARDLRKELRAVKFEKVAEVVPFKEFKQYKECYGVLGAMVKMRCKRTCKGGGGPPFCKMRKCCQDKNINGCWKCGDFEMCKNLGFLEKYHDDAHMKNLRILNNKGIEAFISGRRYW